MPESVAIMMVFWHVHRDESLHALDLALTQVELIVYSRHLVH